MSSVELSSSQISDAVGAFKEAALAISGEAQLDMTPVPTPSYNEVVVGLGVGTSAYFDVPNGQSSQLQMYPGLCVIVGVRILDQTQKARDVYLPGIVLDGSSEPVIGCLRAGPDVIRDDSALKTHLTRPLAELQHTLLGQLYGMHKPGVGTQSFGHTVQAGETAHASLVAVTAPSDIGGLHGRVHDFANRGLAPAISKSGALDISVHGNMRAVDQVLVPASRASRIIVAREHQLPGTNALQLGAGELAVGVALAAVRSKAASSYPQPNLQAGTAALLR